MQTLGSLFDQLSIINQRLWHLEEIRHPESGKADQERLIASDKICIVNKQRAFIIEEIDSLISQILTDPSKHRELRQFKDYKEFNGGKIEST